MSEQIHWSHSIRADGGPALALAGDITASAYELMVGFAHWGQAAAGLAQLNRPLFAPPADPAVPAVAARTRTACRGGTDGPRR